MALRDPIGVWFSELTDNWERGDFYWVDPWGKRKDESYRHYGDLPDGRHFGAALAPAFGDPWARETAIQIVKTTGELDTETEAINERENWPLAMVSSPSGGSLVWLTENHFLEKWCQDKEGFVPYDGGSLKARLDDMAVLDARMGADGILQIRLEDGRTMGYLCDADIILLPREDGWALMDKADLSQLKESCPGFRLDLLPVMIRQKDDAWDYYDCGVRRVCFEPGLEVIKNGILAQNPDIETVTIPASVKRVEAFAFGCCEKLKELVIKGDVSRVADWAEDTFVSCACEEFYKQLRNMYS